MLFQKYPRVYVILVQENTGVSVMLCPAAAGSPPYWRKETPRGGKPGLWEGANIAGALTPMWQGEAGITRDLGEGWNGL